MHDQGDSVADKPSLKYFVVFQRFDVLQFVDRHECWARKCHFEMRMNTNSQDIRKFVGYTIRRRSRFHLVIVRSCMAGAGLVGWLRTKLFASGSIASIFAHYCGLMLCGFDPDNAHIWRNGITVLLVFTPVSSVAAAHNGGFMSKTASPRIVADGLEVLVLMLDRLAR